AAVEIFPGAPPAGRGRNQRQVRDPAGMLDRVEQREQPTPGIPRDREALLFPSHPQRFEIRDLLAPSDRHIARDRRFPAAPLVVVDESTAPGERIEAGAEVSA